jgi:2-dehydro-3-deoxyphosphogluconate aldolase / (4S)-4-hydroxy-2-oxoglutarate aldolase
VRQDFARSPDGCCVGGSWLVPASAVENGDWASITRTALDAVQGAG